VHAKKHAVDTSDFNVVYKIKEFLTALQKDIGEQKKNGWNQDIISNCLTPKGRKNYLDSPQNNCYVIFVSDTRRLNS